MSMNRVGREYNDFCIIVGEPKIGRDVWIGYFTLIDGSGGLTIGDNVTVSSGVHIYTHDSIKKVRYNLPKDHENWSHVSRSPVYIGNNVFIGANSTILRGVTIGDDVTVGANTLVTQDVPPNCLAIGNPLYIKSLEDTTS